MDATSTIVLLPLGLILAALVAIMIILLRRGSSKSDEKLLALEEALADVQGRAESATRERNELAQKAAGSTRELELLRDQIDRLEAERDQLRKQAEAEKEARNSADQARALAEKHAKDVEKRLEDWEVFAQQSKQAATTAALESATKLSSKLLEDHKRENEASKKDSEKRVKETTEGLTGQLENVVKSVASLTGQVNDNRQTMDIIHKALSAPSGAGQSAEMVLENTLKAYGLTEGVDYELQHTVDGTEGEKLRPDALLFLPGDAVMVIDAKASKHLLDMAQAEEDADHTAAQAKLRDSMTKHLRTLTTKDYRNAVTQAYRARHDKGEARQVTTYMFLPNDGAVEKLREADPQFSLKAAQSDIIVGGPTGLQVAIGVAKMRITLGRQEENQQQIVEEVDNLFQSIATMVDLAAKMGRGLTSAANAYDKFSSSVNKRLLPRARRILALGISEPSKGISADLPRLMIQKEVIDADSEPVEDGTDLPLLTRKGD